MVESGNAFSPEPARVVMTRRVRSVVALDPSPLHSRPPRPANEGTLTTKRSQADLFARLHRTTLTGKRDSGPRECVAKEVGVRATAAGVTSPEDRYSQPRLKLQQPPRRGVGFILPAGQH